MVSLGLARHDHDGHGESDTLSLSCSYFPSGFVAEISMRAAAPTHRLQQKSDHLVSTKNVECFSSEQQPPQGHVRRDGNRRTSTDRSRLGDEGQCNPPSRTPVCLTGMVLIGASRTFPPWFLSLNVFMDSSFPRAPPSSSWVDPLFHTRSMRRNIPYRVKVNFRTRSLESTSSAMRVAKHPMVIALGWWDACLVREISVKVLNHVHASLHCLTVYLQSLNACSSSDLLRPCFSPQVELATGAACILGVSAIVMGVLVLAVGTSVPDMIGSMIAARNGEASVRGCLWNAQYMCEGADVGCLVSRGSCALARPLSS